MHGILHKSNKHNFFIYQLLLVPLLTIIYGGLYISYSFIVIGVQFSK